MVRSVRRRPLIARDDLPSLSLSVEREKRWREGVVIRWGERLARSFSVAKIRRWRFFVATAYYE